MMHTGMYACIPFNVRDETERKDQKLESLKVPNQNRTEQCDGEQRRRKVRVVEENGKIIFRRRVGPER